MQPSLKDDSGFLEGKYSAEAEWLIFLLPSLLSLSFDIYWLDVHQSSNIYWVLLQEVIILLRLFSS